MFLLVKTKEKVSYDKLCIAAPFPLENRTLQNKKTNFYQFSL
jgi:hypothetical protein